MKKFTKLFLSCAVVSAMAMSATAAFAELPTTVDITGQVTGTYTVAGASVAITNFVQTGDTLDETKPATYLVVKGADTVAAAQENIAGIDQVDTASATLTGAKTGLGNGNVIEELTEGMTPVPYTVYVGYYNSTGAFKVSKGSFTLTDGSAPVVTSVELMIGDTNGDKELGTTDQTQLARRITGLDVREVKPLTAGNAGKEATIAADSEIKYTTNNGKYVVGDTNGDGELGTTDQTQLARKITGLDVREVKPLTAGDAGKTIKVEPTDWTPAE